MARHRDPRNEAGYSFLPGVLLYLGFLGLVKRGFYKALFYISCYGFKHLSLG